MTMLKFCGLRRSEDIEYANLTLPDYVGFIFAESKRYINIDLAHELKKQLNPQIKTVGVFVNCPIDEITAYNEVADIFQLHGDENQGYIDRLRQLLPQKEIWKAVRVKALSDIISAPVADKYVFDAFSPNAYGGTGTVLNAELILQAKDYISKPFFIAGGINSGNLTDIVKKLNPYGIDLSSGIETEGFKDLTKMKETAHLLRRI